jgi:hypothetical protein
MAVFTLSLVLARPAVEPYLRLLFQGLDGSCVVVAAEGIRTFPAVLVDEEL